MGVSHQTRDMKISTKLSCLSLLLSLILFQVTESSVLGRADTVKRGYRDPDDPRNLFAAMYGGVYKRSGGVGEEDFVSSLTPVERLQLLKSIVNKRGLRDPDDPRNLFHSVHGGVFK